MYKIKPLRYLFVLTVLLSFSLMPAKAQDLAQWPEITNTTKPWTRWWWMGNAVDFDNIKKSLIAFKEAGIGGVEISPIYGVKGEEANFIDFLSPRWMEMLNYTIRIADSLNMQVDMIMGTGWPFGGPQVTPQYAASKLIVNKFSVKQGQPASLNIKVEDEKDRKLATLKHVLAFGKDESFLELTDKLNGNHLEWQSPESDYTVYAIFSAKTGQLVKRSAPGGQGFTLDHYSKEAFNSYTVPFDSAFKSMKGKLRCIFNDSYEVYETDFTPGLFQAFKQLRGYDLKPHVNLLLSETDHEQGNRVKSDYRETISDLLLTEFTGPWVDWSEKYGFGTRLQAHGSPGNLIDLYAAASIPECETFGSMPFDIPGLRREPENIRVGEADPVMLRFSSSAGHISGRPLISSESFTWLRDHFKTALSQCKPEVEALFLNGVNHVFLHGSTYSPERASWPGWKFYASVNFNPQNTIWEDAPSLFSYVTNCQSMLQLGKPDNEVLLYWPVYDIWDQYLDGALFFQLKINSLEEWLLGTNFHGTATRLLEKGYGVDFISDNYLAEAKVANGRILLPGGVYKTLVVPPTRKIPLSTMENLIALNKQGAHIIFEGRPESVPGFNEYRERTAELKKLISENRDETEPVSDLTKSLELAGVYPETLVDTGLNYIRRDIDGEKIYFLVNHTAKTIEGYIPLGITTEAVTIFDPLTKAVGKAVIRTNSSTTDVKLKIAPGQSYFLKTGKVAPASDWIYYNPGGDSYPIEGNWKLTFLKGDPSLPEETGISLLQSWTDMNQQAASFSGSARYEIEFIKPEVDADNWELNLGDVRESAGVWLNGRFLGTSWSNPYTLNTGPLVEGKNKLTIRVTNLPANRIRDLELNGDEWKIFHEINMVNKDYRKFDATKWEPVPSGLLGPVTITPLKQENINIAK